jgi:hypothetical protein
MGIRSDGVIAFASADPPFCDQISLHQRHEISIMFQKQERVLDLSFGNDIAGVFIQFLFMTSRR